MKPPRFFSPTIALLFIIIVLAPILYLMIASLWTTGVGRSAVSFFEKRHIILAQNSLTVGTGVTVFCLALGVPLSFLLYRTNLWGRRLFGAIYLIPVLIRPYIHAIVWSRQSPLIKKLLSADIHSLWGVIFVLTLAYFPFVILATSSGLRSMDRDLEEASLLSHGRWKTMTRITLPLIGPHVLSGAVFVFIFSITDFGVPDILRVKVYPIEVFIQFSAFYNETAATILSLPLMATALSLVLLMRWYMKDRSYIQIGGGFSQPRVYDLGWYNAPVLGSCLIIFGLSLGLPMAVLLRAAGPLSSYTAVLRTSLDQIGYSLFLASAGAACASFMAFSLSYLLERDGSRIHVALGFASFIPLAIPSITLGIGLITLWNRPLVDVVYGSSFIIIIGYVAHFLPFSVIIANSGMRQINPRLEEAAFMSNPRWGKVMTRIVLPLLRRSILAGFFIVFVLSFGELGTTLLIIPPGMETISVKIYNLMHYGAEQTVAALSLILILTILVLSGLFLLGQKSLAKRMG